MKISIEQKTFLTKHNIVILYVIDSINFVGSTVVKVSKICINIVKYQFTDYAA